MPISRLRPNPHPAPGYARRAALRARPTMLSMGGGSYVQKVLAAGPIAYWPLWETSGVVAHCLVNPAQNGTYNSDVSTWPPQTGIGDGYTAPYFDGVNDAIGISTAALAAAYDGQELTLMIWARAQDWVSGAQLVRITGRLAAPADHFHILKNNAIDRLEYYHTGSGTTKATAEAGGQTSTAWRCIALTVSKTADELKGYVNGVQIGVTQNLIGAWGSPGVLEANTTLIGANPLVPPGSQWLGWLAHCALFTRALTQPELADLAAP